MDVDKVAKRYFGIGSLIVIFLWMIGILIHPPRVGNDCSSMGKHGILDVFPDNILSLVEMGI